MTVSLKRLRRLCVLPIERNNWQWAANDAMLKILEGKFIPNVTVKVSGEWINTDTRLVVGEHYARY